MHGGEAAPQRDTNVQTSTLGGVQRCEGNFIRASDGMQEYQLLEQPPDHVQPMEGGWVEKNKANMIDSERTNRGTPTIFKQGENEERSHSTATAHRSARTNFQKYYKVRKMENGNTTKHRCHRILPQGYDEEKNNKNDT